MEEMAYRGGEMVNFRRTLEGDVEARGVADAVAQDDDGTGILRGTSLLNETSNLLNEIDALYNILGVNAGRLQEMTGKIYDGKLNNLMGVVLASVSAIRVAREELEYIGKIIQEICDLAGVANIEEISFREE